MSCPPGNSRTRASPQRRRGYDERNPPEIRNRSPVGADDHIGPHAAPSNYRTAHRISDAFPTPHPVRAGHPAGPCLEFPKTSLKRRTGRRPRRPTSPGVRSHENRSNANVHHTIRAVAARTRVGAGALASATVSDQRVRRRDNATTPRADMNGTIGIDHCCGSRTAETKLGFGSLPGPKLVFLFFEAFFSFVNTKEKKAYPAAGYGGIIQKEESYGNIRL